MAITMNGVDGVGGALSLTATAMMPSAAVPLKATTNSSMT